MADHFPSEGSDIITQLRNRNLGKGALEKRAADEIRRLRKQNKRSANQAFAWREVRRLAEAGADPRKLAEHLTTFPDREHKQAARILAQVALALDAGTKESGE